MDNNIIIDVSKTLGVKQEQVIKVLTLLEEGNTILLSLVIEKK